MAISPVQKGVETSLVTGPVPGPSLETPVVLGTADGKGDPLAEVTSWLLPAQPGAEGPLVNSHAAQQEQADRKPTPSEAPRGHPLGLPT